MIRVALADDHPIVLTGIRALIEAEPQMTVAATASTGLEALARFAADPPDVAVVDISMPGLDGVELIRRLKVQMPALRLLALTVHEDAGYLHLALRAGVDGYLLKRSAAENLVRAIRAAAGGEMYLDPAIAAKAVAPPSARPQPLAVLSDREADVLKLVAQGFTTKEIADQLGISTKTAETYKSRAAEKLELRTRVQIVRFAAAKGWLTEF